MNLYSIYVGSLISTLHCSMMLLVLFWYNSPSSVYVYMVVFVFHDVYSWGLFFRDCFPWHVFTDVPFCVHVPMFCTICIISCIRAHCITCLVGKATLLLATQYSAVLLVFNDLHVLYRNILIHTVLYVYPTFYFIIYDRALHYYIIIQVIIYVFHCLSM